MPTSPQSHDKGFKTEMGRIVDLQLWEEALAAAGAAKRELATTLAARQQDVVNAQRVLQQFEAEVRGLTGLLSLHTGAGRHHICKNVCMERGWFLSILDTTAHQSGCDSYTL